MSKAAPAPLLRKAPGAAAPRFLVVLVLYRMEAQASPAWKSLRRILDESPAAFAFELMLGDNSPGIREAPPDFQGIYLHEPGNPGLARHYNLALSAARERGIPWLILLDQDTTATREWVEELVQLAGSAESADPVVAFAPKLVERGEVHSPRRPPGLRTEVPLSPDAYGILPERVHVYNSGAALKVSALAAIGGFPERFPLDYLDHATFHALQAAGGKVFVLKAALQHQLSANHEDARTSEAYRCRLRGVRAAEHAFYRCYGSPRDRFLCSRRFFRRAGGALLAGDFPGCLRALRFALRP